MANTLCPVRGQCPLPSPPSALLLLAHLYSYFSSSSDPSPAPPPPILLLLLLLSSSFSAGRLAGCLLANSRNRSQPGMKAAKLESHFL